MKIKRKMFLSIVFVLSLILIVSSATYAVYRWRSTYGLNVDIRVNDSVVITFNGGTDITGTLTPIDINNYNEASENRYVTKSMIIKSNYPTDSVYSLYLKINSLPNELKNESFKWHLYESGRHCSDEECIDIVGDFSPSSIAEYTDSTTGDLLLIDSSSFHYRNETYLYLKLWIDGTVDNDISMSGKHIDFDIYATGTGDSLREVSE